MLKKIYLIFFIIGTLLTVVACQSTTATTTLIPTTSSTLLTSTTIAPSTSTSLPTTETITTAPSTTTTITTTTNHLITLPDLSMMTQEQALQVLSSYLLFVSTDKIATNEVPDGTFVRYGNGLLAGMEVTPFTSIVLLFAQKANQLPDLTGKTTSEIYSILTSLDIIIEVQTLLTNDVPEGQFVSYGLNRKAGDILPLGAEVIVFVAQPIITVNRNIIISKYVEGSSYNSAIELYNPSSEAVDLSEFMLALYLDGSETVTTRIPLSGILLPGETYLVAFHLATPELVSQADLLTDLLIINGNDTVVLEYYNGVIVDQIGFIGWGLFYLHDQTLVRKPSILTPSNIFSIDEWDSYAKDNISMLGTHPVEYPTTFTFDPSYLAIDFNQKGGMIQVTFVSNNDGDTAQFLPGFTFDNRVRFIGIDTPEMSSGDPVAVGAKNYVYNRLKNATTIYLQHDPRSGNIDTYSRYLALIWVDGSLLNYELVYYGYSQNNYQDTTNALVFNGITLSRWMSNAEAYAKANRLGVWG
jgi:endonuclease YncB( thermonuclease family)